MLVRCTWYSLLAEHSCRYCNLRLVPAGAEWLEGLCVGRQQMTIIEGRPDTEKWSRMAGLKSGDNYRREKSLAKNV
jgi:hypothetical protein